MVLAPNPGLCNTRTTEGELSNGLNRVQASKSTSLRDKLAECHSYTTKSLKASCVFPQGSRHEKSWKQML